MSSFWNKNISLFCSRFPLLAAQLGVSKNTPEPETFPFVLEKARDGSPTARQVSGETEVRLHSAYNPVREAKNAVDSIEGNSKNFSVAVFEGAGLGYLPIEFAKRCAEDPNSNKKIVVIEPDLDWLLASFCVLDWEPVFAVRDCVFCVRAAHELVLPILNNFGLDGCAFFGTDALKAHARPYFDALDALVARNRRKDALNSATKRRFSWLWSRNMCRSLEKIAACAGVNKFSGCAEHLPFVVLGAGPSLREIAPHLSQMKSRAVIVATDTALRLCLEQGVEPDFVVIMDPQYWAWRHIAGLKAPSSRLITESAVYPAAFHFDCKEILVCSPLFPLGQYAERLAGEKGALAAGGSVATSAWDFCRLCGAKRIYLAGVDLAFPDRQTHYRGCTFEEQAHSSSTRILAAETAGISALFGADVCLKSDYEGNPVLTDSRMTMFAWWFESAVSGAKSDGIETLTLSPKGLCVPGISASSVEAFLALPEARAQREGFFLSAENSPLNKSLSASEAARIRKKAARALKDGDPFFAGKVSAEERELLLSFLG